MQKKGKKSVFDSIDIYLALIYVMFIVSLLCQIFISILNNKQFSSFVRFKRKEHGKSILTKLRQSTLNFGKALIEKTPNVPFLSVLRLPKNLHGPSPDKIGTGACIICAMPNLSKKRLRQVFFENQVAWYDLSSKPDSHNYLPCCLFCWKGSSFALAIYNNVTGTQGQKTL